MRPSVTLLKDYFTITRFHETGTYYGHRTIQFQLRVTVRPVNAFQTLTDMNVQHLVWENDQGNIQHFLQAEVYDTRLLINVVKEKMCTYIHIYICTHTYIHTYKCISVTHV